jgi:hypothetical protein
MTPARSAPPDSVPTLTEVIDWPRAASAPGDAPVEEPPLAPSPQPVRDPGDPLPSQDPSTEPEPANDPPAVPDDEPAPPPVRAGETRPSAAGGASEPGTTVLNERQLKERILVDLQRQIDAVIEYRMREVLTPILTRATDSIVRDARTELSRSLRTWIDQSVTQELRRQRGD